ncbi:MAG: hypothetical protein ABIP29_07550 [Candidatus Eisenbacteria bacterium]
MSHPTMRTARGPLAVLALALFLGVTPAAPARAGKGGAGTDAWTAASPAKPWLAGTVLEVAGQRTWTAAGPGAAQAMLRVGYVGVLPSDARRAVDDLLTREKAAIREEVDDRRQVERSSFEPDSMIAAGPGGLRWHGFRVSVSDERVTGTSWRWVALHPRFPAARRAFTLAYDESAPRGGSAPARLNAARSRAASLAPAGRGLAGPLDEAWLDARAAAFAARIDSAQRLCWTRRADAASGREHVGYGRGLAIEGDFYVLSDAVPRDSVADPAPAEYGAAFDRNGDGRLDLLVVNRGLQPFAGRDRQPTVALYADDDFDGRVDALLVEDADRDADRHVDARLLVLDPDEDGRADQARAFSAGTAGAGDRVPLQGGRVRARRMGQAADASDFVEVFRTASLRLAELDRARAACPR